MSESVMSNETPSFLKFKGLSLLGALGAGVFWLWLLVGSGETHGFALNSFVYGYAFWFLLTLGCLALSILHNSIKSSWTLAVLRIFEAGSSWQMFLILAIFFLPVAKNLPIVYEWARPEFHAHKVDEALAFKHVWLQPSGFYIRGIIYLVILGFISATLRRSTNRHDKNQDPQEFQFRTNFASPMLVVFAIVITFLLTDLTMSLTPHWYSTIYPLWLVLGGCQAALSLGTYLVCSNATKDPYKGSMSPALTKDLGNMMFVLTMLWGYTSVSQLIILWNGNLPETASFYAHRGGDAKFGWNFIGASTILGCFVIPFVTLLAPRVKRYPERLKNIAAFIFAFRIVDVFWIIGAAIQFRQVKVALPVIWDVAGFVLMGFVWFAVMLWRVEKAPLLPLYDNRLKEAKANAH
ncbi:MAG TPA: hypothetical protein VK171_13915 [Fimbriimonas sp.]|nr:hypothetical protein [Fimbriimonas sp.]